MQNIARKNVPDNTTAKPVPLAVMPDNIPAELKALPNWVVWRYTWKPDKKRKDGSGELGEWDKPPFDATAGTLAKTNDASTWSDFDTALAAYRTRGWDGLGFVPTVEAGIVAVDLDKCRNKRTGGIKKWAQEYIDQLDTYCELSPSGLGFRLFAFGAKPGKLCKKGPVEIYDHAHYLTVCGHHLVGTPTTINERTEQLAKVYADVFGTNTTNTTAATPSTNGDTLDDDTLLAKAMAAKNGTAFASLWAGDTTGYTTPSEADLALCGHLAFWVGPDPDRIDRLFRRSGLFREKWDRGDYRQRTITTALQGRTEFYKPSVNGTYSHAKEVAAGVTMEHEAAGGRLLKITVRVNGEVAHVDVIDAAVASQRRRLCKALVAKVPTLDTGSIDRELLALADASKPTNTPPADAPEVDISMIVRPEQFYTPEVAGLSVSTVRLVNGTPEGRWSLYLRWPAGRRECRQLAGSIDLVDGKRLWIHPQPGPPSPTTAAGWSAESRQAWVKGETSVNPAKLFQRIQARFRRFLDLPTDTADGTTATLALWTLLTYCFRPWNAVPYLFIGGPLSSGKTRVFEVLSRLVFRPLLSSSTTGPCMFRSHHENGGTLLFDEAERLRQPTPDQSELLAMLLGGYRGGGKATRLEAVGDTFRPVSFDVFGPKALACIGGLPPALASRCITVAMFRAGPGSDKPRRRLDDDGGWPTLRDHLHVMALDNGTTWLELAGRQDVCPAGINGRDYELWQPLLGLAAFIESHGEGGLLATMQAYALASIDKARDDAVPDQDENLLELLGLKVRQNFAPTPGELLAEAQQRDTNAFAKWSPRTVSNRLKSYGIVAKKTTRGRREYSGTTLADLYRIQNHYGIDLEIKEGDTHP